MPGWKLQQFSCYFISHQATLAGAGASCRGQAEHWARGLLSLPSPVSQGPFGWSGSWWETGPKSSLHENRRVVSDEHLEWIINLILSSVLCCVYFFCLLFVLSVWFFFSPCSFWSTWLIPIFGALVIGLMYRYYMLDGRTSWTDLPGTSESLKERVRESACMQHVEFSFP